jgi:hypothetical protein
MSDHKSHQADLHVHGPGCGHASIGHRGHEDYVQDGRLDHVHAGTVTPHSIEVDQTNPASCTPMHACGGHAADHRHGAACGHASVPHGDHFDYVVGNHLHHPCDKHCDDHGPVQFRSALRNAQTGRGA